MTNSNKPSTPNILFIQTDQLTAFALGAYGCEFAKTPHIDALAHNGAVFENAYCNFPLCAPSRYSMASGQLASRIGAYDNAVEFPASIPTYAHYLRSFGYQTCLSGKMHFVGPDQLHGFEQRLTPDIYPADFSWAPNWKNEGQRDTSDTTGVTVSGKCLDSVQLKYDNLVQERALDKLTELSKSSDQRPFFLQVSYTHPHDPYLCLPEHWDLYDDVDIPLPSIGAMHSSKHDVHSARILKQHSMLDFEFDQNDIRRARRAYFGSVSYIDDCVGELVSMLEQLNLRENTIVVFTSDHGEMMGERGMWFKKTFFEPAMRIPLIVNNASRFSPTRIETPASLVDLLPSFMAWASAGQWRATIEPLDGHDLTPFILGEQTNLNRTIRAEYLSETTPAPIYMIKKGQYKFIYSVEDPLLLFDLDSDPDETANIASLTSMKAVVEEFKHDIEQHWDNTALTDAILLSQSRRQLIIAASKFGHKDYWDYDEGSIESVPWYRGLQGYNQWAYDYTPEDQE